MMEDAVKDMLAYWLPKLGLQSWGVKVEFVPRRDIDGAACAHIKAGLERVTIKLSRQEDRDENSDPVELDLLHELVHVRFWAIDPHDAQGVLHDCREVAVEWTARALYAARYEGAA